MLPAGGATFSSIATYVWVAIAALPVGGPIYNSIATDMLAHLTTIEILYELIYSWLWTLCLLLAMHIQGASSNLCLSFCFLNFDLHCFDLHWFEVTWFSYFRMLSSFIQSICIYLLLICLVSCWFYLFYSVLFQFIQFLFQRWWSAYSMRTVS